MENSSLKILHISRCSMFSDFLRDLQPFWIGYFVVAVNGILCLTAVLGNLLILAALHNSPLHSPSKMLFCCLASTDLCVGLLAQPCFVIYATLLLKETLNICQVAERLMHISSSALCGISLCTVTAISVDRRLALRLGLRYRQVVTPTRVRTITTISWMVLLPLSMLYFWNTNIVKLVFCVIVLICLIASTFCYSKIYFTLRRRQARVWQQSEHGELPMSTRANVLKYKKTVVSSIWVYLTLIACYFPFAIVQIAEAIRGVSMSIFIAEGSMISLLYLNSSINPVIYCWRIKEVRQAVKTIIGRLCSLHFC